MTLVFNHRARARRDGRALLRDAFLLIAAATCALRAAAIPDDCNAGDLTVTVASVSGTLTGLALAEPFLYWTESSLHRARVLDIRTLQASTVAGDGLPGFIDGRAGRLNVPAGLAYDPGGYMRGNVTVGPRLFISDINDRIRAVSLSPPNYGEITTVVGPPPGVLWTQRGGDWVNMTISGATGLAFDPALARLYIASTGSHRVLFVDFAGNRTGTLIGNGVSNSAYSDGVLASTAPLPSPVSIFRTSDGTLMVGSTACVTAIRNVSGTLRVYRVAGSCTSRAFAGDALPVSNAAVRVQDAYAVMLPPNATGERPIFFVDTSSHRVRWVDAAGTINTYGGNGGTQSSSTPSSDNFLSPELTRITSPRGLVYSAQYKTTFVGGSQSIRAYACVQTCPPGLVCDALGVWPPTPCPGGRMCLDNTTTAGNTTAGIVCPAGTYAYPGSSSCTPTPPGKWSPKEWGQEPLSCNVGGFYCPGNCTTASCVRASSGYYATAPNATTQFPCAAGFECPSGTNLPVPCRKGYYCPPLTGSINSVLMCKEGYLCLGSCTNETGANVNSTDPVKCPAGFFAISGSSTPTGLCAPGYSCGEGSTTLFGDGPCPAGTWCAAGSAAPEPCEPGTYSTTVGRSRPCEECPPDTYNPTRGANSSAACLPCPRRSSTGGLGGATTLSACVPGAFACERGRAPLVPVPKTDSDCGPLVCALGLVPSAEGTSCVGCPHGSTGVPVSGVGCRTCSAQAGEICPGFTSVPLLAGTRLLAMQAETPATLAAALLALANTSSSAAGRMLLQTAEEQHERWQSSSSSGSSSGSRHLSVVTDPDDGTTTASPPQPLVPFADPSCSALRRGLEQASSARAVKSKLNLRTAVIGIAGNAAAICAVLFFMLCADRCCVAPAQRNREAAAAAEQAAAAAANGRKRRGSIAAAVAGSQRLRGCTERVGCVLRRIDSFGLQHSWKDGEAVVKRNTALGGVFSAAGALFLMSVWLSLVLQRQADNVIETTTISGLSRNVTATAARMPVAALGPYSGLYIVLTAAGEPGACLNATWSSSGLYAGQFQHYATACASDAVALAAGAAPNNGSRPSFSVAQHTFACPDCVISGGSQLTVSLHWSCQALSFVAAAIDPSGQLSVENATLDAVDLPPATTTTSSSSLNSGSSGTGSGSGSSSSSGSSSGSGGSSSAQLFTSVRWSLPPMLGWLRAVEGGYTRGLSLLQASLSATRDDAMSVLVPSLATLSVQVDLNPPALYQRVEQSQKQTVLQLLASLAGIGGALGIFSRAFSLSEPCWVWAVSRADRSKQQRERKALEEQQRRTGTAKVTIAGGASPDSETDEGSGMDVSMGNSNGSGAEFTAGSPMWQRRRQQQQQGGASSATGPKLPVSGGAAASVAHLAHFAGAGAASGAGSGSASADGTATATGFSRRRGGGRAGLPAGSTTSRAATAASGSGMPRNAAPGAVRSGGRGSDDDQSGSGSGSGSGSDGDGAYGSGAGAGGAGGGGSSGRRRGAPVRPQASGAGSRMAVNPLAVGRTASNSALATGTGSAAKGQPQPAVVMVVKPLSPDAIEMASPARDVLISSATAGTAAGTSAGATASAGAGAASAGTAAAAAGTGGSSGAAEAAVVPGATVNLAAPSSRAVLTRTGSGSGSGRNLFAASISSASSSRKSVLRLDPEQLAAAVAAAGRTSPSPTQSPARKAMAGPDGPRGPPILLLPQTEY